MDSPVTQMRKGVLEYCVLALLAGRPRYGYELVQDLAGVDGMLTSEGTIYPLLSRLHRERLVDTEWKESTGGPPRKYYRGAARALLVPEGVDDASLGGRCHRERRRTMSAPHATQIVEGYLARLEVALAALPPVRRADLVSDLRAHIADARAGLTEETDAALLDTIERLGDPMVIATEAIDQPDQASQRVNTTTVARWGWIELAGVLLTILMWPVGAILVLLSPLWSRREKVIGTALGAITFLTGSLFAPLMGMVVAPVLSALGPPLAPMLLGSVGLLPIVAAAYLATRLYRRESYLPGLASTA